MKAKKAALLAVVGAIVIILVMMMIGGAINRGTCWWYGYSLERATQYKPFIGCTVKTAQGWIPRSELRTVQ